MDINLEDDSQLDQLGPSTGPKPGTVPKVPAFAVIKKKIFSEDNTQYILMCRTEWTKENKVFRLELRKDGKAESKLELPYNDLRRILDHLEYKGVMPITFHISQIRDYFTMMKYLLLAFCTIRDVDGTDDKELAIYPMPINLLSASVNDMPITNFIGTECVIILAHVAGRTFRTTLADPEIVNEPFRIDIDFDKATLDHYFKQYHGSDAFLRSAWTIVDIINGYDADVTDKKLSEFMEIKKSLLDPMRCDEEELDSFKVIKESLVEDLGFILKELTDFSKSIGIVKMSQLCNEKKAVYCKLKVRKEMKKVTLYMVMDNPDKQALEVKIKNFYETFAPNGKVKAFGEHEYPYESTWKHFGVRYTELSHQDKLAICSLVMEMYRMDTFEEKIQKEDLEKYRDNPISFVPVEVGVMSKTFPGDNDKFSLTLTSVSIGGESKGIRAVISNEEAGYEVGMFLHVNSSVWTVAADDVDEKKKLGIESDYLEYVLRKCGWDMLKDWLPIEKKLARVDAKGIKVGKGYVYMEQLENVLNSRSVLKYLMEK